MPAVNVSLVDCCWRQTSPTAWECCSSQLLLVEEIHDSNVLSGVRPCPKTSFESDMEIDVYIRQNAFSDIVLSNGANMFQFGLTRSRMVYYISLVSDAVHTSTSQVDTRGPTSPSTETTPLLAPNVFGCSEAVLQPRFAGERDMYGNAALSGARPCPREQSVHDERTHSISSKIKRVLPDRNIITVDARRFHCADVWLQRKGASGGPIHHEINVRVLRPVMDWRSLRVDRGTLVFIRFGMGR